MALSISQGTVVRSLREMEMAGQVVRIQGKGTRVAEPPAPGRSLALVIREWKVENSAPLQVTFFQRTRYLMEAAADLGVPIHLFMVTELVHEIKTAERILSDNSLKGVLLYEAYGLENLMAVFRQRQYPFVALYGAEDTKNGVVLDDAGGAHEAMKYLFSFGHERIAVISGPSSTPCYRDRLDGIRAAWAERGKAIPEELVFPSLAGQEGGYRAMLQILDLPKRPTAVFCLSDFKATGALEAAREKGLRVPQDISILGFDGLDFSALTSPPLTSFAIPNRLIAEEGLRRLLSHGDGKPDAKRPPVLKIELRSGQSVADLRSPGHRDAP